MEALFAVFAEALVAIVMAVVELLAVLFGGVLASLAAAIGELLAALFGIALNKRQGSQSSGQGSLNSDPGFPGSQSSPSRFRQVLVFLRSPGFRRWSRRITIGAGILTSILLIGLLILNQWFFEDVGRWVLNNHAKKSGLEIQAQKLDGSIFTGRLHAGGIVVKRNDEARGTIDLNIDNLEVDVSIMGLFKTPIPVSRVNLSGIRGRYVRGAEKQAAEKRSARTLKRERRGVTVADLTVSGVEVIYDDPTLESRPSIPITIEQLSSKPFRSRFAVFDALFRSNAKGSIAGKPFQIVMTGDDQGRQTEWTASDLPVPFLALLGGPFAFLESGNCDVRIVDRWKKTTDREIFMDWNLTLKDVQARVPESFPPSAKAFATPIVGYFNSRGNSQTISFTLTIDQNRFDGAASADAAGLWDAAADALAKDLAKRLETDPEKVKAFGRGARDVSKDLLDRWRKKK